MTQVCQRSPICVVVGHVDHGKSSILDRIRGTSIVSGEAGRITQAIGASIVPIESIRKFCGKLLSAMKLDLSMPGLLFIDTPGHAAFTSLRKRGGNLADIAILVVDINEGFKPQTIEAIEILKQFKTPFIVAANKVDLIPGWRERREEQFLLPRIKEQAQDVQKALDNKLYELVAKVYEYGFESERYDRVKDFTKQVAIVPCSAETGAGMPELLVMIAGLAQRFLADKTKCDLGANAKGTILEVKDVQGLGTTMDVIIYDGILRCNDTIVIGTLDGEPIVSKVRALLQPKPLNEMRDRKAKFLPVKEAAAAIGVKISAPGTDDVMAGMPIVSCGSDEVEEAKREVTRDVTEAFIETGDEGIIIKADTIGSVEAVTKLFTEKGIPIRRTGVGPITKRDVMDAESNTEKTPLLAAVVGFNVEDTSGLDTVKVITGDIIYKLLEGFEKWQEETKIRLESKELEGVTMPVKLEVMKGYIFRQSNPAVCGIDVISGVLFAGTPIMKNGKNISTIHSIQSEGKNITEAQRGKQVAASMDHVTIGRQVEEGDILYSFIREDEFRKLKEKKRLLSKEQVEILKEIAEIMRKENQLWGV